MRKLLAVLLVVLIVLAPLPARAGVPAPPVEIRVSAPLELRFAPAGLEVRGELPARVRLHLRGPETRLRTLQPEEVAVFINLNTATAGHYRFVLDARNAEVPPGVEVVSFVPSEVELDLVPH